MHAPRRNNAYSFLTSTLDVVNAVKPWPRFTAEENTAGTQWTGGSVGLRAGLDTEVREKILCLCRGSNPGRPVYSQTLYWLSYPSSLWHIQPWNIPTTYHPQIFFLLLSFPQYKSALFPSLFTQATRWPVLIISLRKCPLPRPFSTYS
jgi:hypothetical protein